MAGEAAAAPAGARERAPYRTAAAAVATALAVLAVTLAAAALSGPRGGRPALLAEVAASGSATWLDAVARALPFGYAFGAGMLAAVNPCGFALLPAYLALYVGAQPSAGMARAAAHALGVALTVTAVFVGLFGATGALLAVASTGLVRYFPWAGLLVGVLLVGAASWMLAGGSLYGRLGDELADRVGGAASGRGYLAYASFGLAYGLASLGCTLPIFLTVVGSTVVARGFVAALAQFVLYGSGMGFVIAVLTLGVAVFQGSVLTRVRALTPYVGRASAALLLVTGAFVAYYWLTLGGLLGG